MYLAAELGHWDTYDRLCKALATELQYGQALTRLLSGTGVSRNV